MSQARLKQQLRKDQRRGRKSLALQRLRQHTARTGNHQQLLDFMRRHHIDDDLDTFHQERAQEALGIGTPFDHPRLEPAG